MIWLLAPVVAALLYGAFRYRRRIAARRALLSMPLDDAARDIVFANVPITTKMPPELRSRLEGRINLFLKQVTFHGCDGLVVTEEMRLTIAAQACVLIAGNDAWFSTLRTILLYPGAFRSRRAVEEGFIVTEGETVRIGESWSRGPVILSWSDTKEGALIDDDGHNVAFHEFAHQLDDLSGETNGIPLLGSGERMRQWAVTFEEAFRRYNLLIDIGKEPFLDAYGATAPEELFAVAVEAFFERPRAMLQHEPDLYRQLVAYFRQDPARWP